MYFLNLKAESVTEVARVLMKGIFHKLYLFACDISHQPSARWQPIAYN